MTFLQIATLSLVLGISSTAIACEKDVSSLSVEETEENQNSQDDQESVGS